LSQLSDEENARRERMIKRGMSYHDVAKVCGVTHSSIIDWCELRGIKSVHKVGGPRRSLFPSQDKRYYEV
jgi:transposase